MNEILERSHSAGVLPVAEITFRTAAAEPAEPGGGLAMIKAIAAPFPGLRFVPTGGIDSSDLESYLADPLILAVGGSWMVKSTSVKARDWIEVTKSARAAVATVHRARGSQA